MILTCPNCGTQYVVKDGAIPAQGRQVRCANCKHSWHQDPETAPFEADQETLSEATMIDPSSGPEAEERAYEEAVIEEAAAEEASQPAQPAVEPVEAVPAGSEEAAADERGAPDIQEYDAPPEAEPQADDDFSPFAERDYVEPRRRSPLLALLLVLVVVAALAAAFWFLAPPEWKARLGIAEAGATPLQLTLTHSDRQPLASGGESLTVTGRVINPTSKSHSVPPIYAQLKTRSGQVIYAWTIQPPAPTLKPGASASFNSTEVNVPPGGDDLTISLGAPKA